MGLPEGRPQDQMRSLADARPRSPPSPPAPPAPAAARPVDARRLPRRRSLFADLRAVRLQQRLAGGHHHRRCPPPAPRSARPSPPPPPPRPSSSRCTGPTLTITPTSGWAIAVSSAICPGPRIAISSTSASVSGGAASTARGRPISVLRFRGLATVAAATLCARSSAARMSFVEVLPGRAGDRDDLRASRPSSRRHALRQRLQRRSGSGWASTAPCASAASGLRACSGATSTPHAPAPSACAA